MLHIGRAKRAVKFFNKKTQYPAADAVIAKAFSAKLNPHSHFVQVTLLDALFATNLGKSKPAKANGGRRKPLVEISESIIRARRGDIKRQLQRLRPQKLMKLDLESEQVRCLIRNVTEAVVSCCSNRAFSFATKYLHFLKPHLFAPWDSIVPEVAKCLLPDLTLRSRRTADNYLQLLKAHQRIWSEFTPEQQGELLNYDFCTQPEKWRRRNSPVRVVDKILWAIGKSNRVGV